MSGDHGRIRMVVGFLGAVDMKKDLRNAKNRTGMLQRAKEQK